MSINSEYIVVLTTFSDEKIGKRVIESLLEKDLAACIQVQDITSYYKWEGKVANEDEKLLFIKSKKSLYNEIEKDILANHDYDIPEIICLPIDTGFSRYLNWIKDECK